MSLTRRGFVLGMLALGAAPAIVKASSIMRVRPILAPSGVDWGAIPPAMAESLSKTLFDAAREMKRCHISPDRNGYYHAFVHPSNRERFKCELGLTLQERIDELVFQHLVKAA